MTPWTSDGAKNGSLGRLGLGLEYFLIWTRRSQKFEGFCSDAHCLPCLACWDDLDQDLRGRDTLLPDEIRLDGGYHILCSRAFVQLKDNLRTTTILSSRRHPNQHPNRFSPTLARADDSTWSLLRHRRTCLPRPYLPCCGGTHALRHGLRPEPFISHIWLLSMPT